MSENKGLRLECECVGRCTILCIDFDRYGEDEASWVWDFYTNAGYQGSWRQRLRIIWSLLRGEDHYFHGSQHTADDMRRLRRYIDQTLPGEPWKPSPPTTTAGGTAVYVLKG